MGRKVLLLCAVGIGWAGIAGLFAMPASAALTRLANGKEISYQPIFGKAPQGAKAPQQFEPVFSNLDYSGGPVMPANVNYTIVWKPSNYTGTQFQTDSTPSDGYVFGVNQYLQDVAHDSGGHNNADSVSTQYNDAAGDKANYSAAYGGSFTDTDPLPANGCPALSGDICITDAQIQTELNSFLTAHSLPRDMTHEYFLLTPPDVASCFDAAGHACSANADGNQAYCAYHGASATASSFIYANIPDLTGNGSCDPFIIGFVLDYPNSYADGVLSSLAHEHNESITDPQPNNAWTDWQPGCSGSDETCGGENGDKCAYYELNDPNSDFSNDTAFNQVINGREYWLQAEWSNQAANAQTGQAGHCLDGWTSNGHAAHASFTQTQGAGNAVSFNASASTGSGGVKEYVWQFNDDVTPGDTPQQSTVETTKPTISHTFPQAGDYTVALTVMTSDGTSDGAAHTVTAGASLPPTAAFTFSPGSPFEGTAVQFNGGISSDPNPGGKIDQYSWDFGDGASSTQATPSHTYAKAGTYHVTLTVTGSEGKSGQATHDVTVADELPTAAFTPPSGVRAGSPASFDGRASNDADGSISTYAWSFGDGSAASGATASHTYGHAGTFTVTLRVTDSDGRAASVSHPVTVGSSGTGGGGSGGGGGGAKCTVPALRHQTLSKAHRLLQGGGCVLGKVTKPRHRPKRRAGRHKVWKLVVVHQSPAAKQTGPASESIAVKLGWVALKR
jgi:PKD repeat protein